MTAREPSAVPGRNPFRPDDGTCGRSFRSGSGYYRDCVLPPHGPEVRHSAIGPASAAREPSAVEVIAEALSGHTRSTDPEYVCDCGYQPSDDDPRQDWYAHVCHQTTAALAALEAAGFVVATRDEIRAMSVQEQAELIGGEVEQLMKPRPNSNRSDLHWVPSGRVVGPWVEVQP